MRPILPFDAAAGEWQARERARLSRIGRTPPYAETQIAVVNGLILVAHNAPDFAQFAGLIVENWFDRPAEAKPWGRAREHTDHRPIGAGRSASRDLRVWVEVAALHQ